MDGWKELGQFEIKLEIQSIGFLKAQLDPPPWDSHWSTDAYVRAKFKILSTFRHITEHQNRQIPSVRRHSIN